MDLLSCMGHGQKSLQNTPLAHSNYSLLKTTIAFTELLSLFHYSLISKCITHMPMPPISKEIISSQTTSYTSLYIPPMILDLSQVLKRQNVLNSLISVLWAQEAICVWHTKPTKTSQF